MEIDDKAMRNRGFWAVLALMLAAVIAASGAGLSVHAREKVYTAYYQEDSTRDTVFREGADGAPAQNTADGTAGEPEAPSLLNYISFAPEKGRTVEPADSAGGFRARAVSLLTGYLLGMFLTAEVVTRKLTGRPCSELGETGNPGMANVMAHLGMKPGFTVLAGDIGKTVAATLLSWVTCGSSIGRLAILYAALGVTLGHNYPAWNRFHGGKGVATTCAGIAAFSFGWGIGADLVGALAVVLSHYLCIGAIVIPLVFLIPVFVLYGTEAGTVAVILAALMAVKHMPAVLGIRTGSTSGIDLIGRIRERAGRKRTRSDAVDAGAGAEEQGTGAAAHTSDSEEELPAVDGSFLRELRRQRGAAAVARMDMEKEIIRQHIIFYGRVQGVGFRYQAMYGARQYGLTGWVENLEDGTVEMEVQGTAAGIGRLLTQLRSGRWIRIDGMEAEDEPVQPDERGFRVRGY